VGTRSPRYRGRRSTCCCTETPNAVRGTACSYCPEILSAKPILLKYNVGWKCAGRCLLAWNGQPCPVCDGEETPHPAASASASLETRQAGPDFSPQSGSPVHFSLSGALVHLHSSRIAAEPKLPWSWPWRWVLQWPPSQLLPQLIVHAEFGEPSVFAGSGWVAFARRIHLLQTHDPH
jgi:hypothetical protein